MNSLRIARDIALSALQQYDLDWKQIRFLQNSDSVTFRIDTGHNEHDQMKSEQPYALAYLREFIANRMFIYSNIEIIEGGNPI